MFTTLLKRLQCRCFPVNIVKCLRRPVLKKTCERLLLCLLILNPIGNNCPEFRNELLDSFFFKLTLGSDCLEFCFRTVTFKTILTQ